MMNNIPMIVGDGVGVVSDDNFDYDPDRALDIIEMTTVEPIAKGEFKNELYFFKSAGQFSFWRASGDDAFSQLL